MDWAALAYVVNLSAGWYMTGVVLIAQRVQYPQFALIPADAAPACHKAHLQRMGPVVAPAMLLEALSATGLLLVRPVWLNPAYVYVIAGLTALAWLLTFAVAVPQHNLLSRAWTEPTIRKLIAYNWIRVAVWASRGILMSVLLCQHLAST